MTMERSRKIATLADIEAQQKVVLDLVALQNKTPEQFTRMNHEASLLLGMIRSLQSWHRLEASRRVVDANFPTYFDADQRAEAVVADPPPYTPPAAPVRRATPVAHQSGGARAIDLVAKLVVRVTEMRQNSEITPVQFKYAVRYLLEHPEEILGHLAATRFPLVVDERTGKTPMEDVAKHLIKAGLAAYRRRNCPS